MKHLTIDEFINNLPEEDIWKLIEDYEKYGFESSFLKKKARDYCDETYYLDFMTKIVMSAYRYFAMKYKENLK